MLPNICRTHANSTVADTSPISIRQPRLFLLSKLSNNSIKPFCIATDISLPRSTAPNSAIKAAVLRHKEVEKRRLCPSGEMVRKEKMRHRTLHR